MSESGNSNSASATPVFNLKRFSNPKWVVLVNDKEVKDAILERVDNGYGSELSTATFTVPRNPLTENVGFNEYDNVTIVVNNTTVFEGFIHVITDLLGQDGLKITYTAVSNVARFQEQTIQNGSYNADGSEADGHAGIIFTSGIINQIMVLANKTIPNASISGIPTAYPGEVNITDKNLLEAIETVLNKVGNYKLYYDMNKDTLNIYKLQSGGLNTRSFIPGKNIISYNITKSTANVVDKVIVIGPRIQITARQSIGFGPESVTINSAGQRVAQARLNGLNIRNVSVEGMTCEQPKITYNNTVVANELMLNYTPLETFDPLAEALNDSSQDNIKEGSNLELRPAVSSVFHYTPEWSSVNVTVVPIKPSIQFPTANPPITSVNAYLSDPPKLWQANFAEGDVLAVDLGLPVEVGEENKTVHVQILHKLYYTVGSMRVTYTYDFIKPAIIVGTGNVVRTITDSQYQVIINGVTGYSNQGFIEFSMRTRAQAEYDRLHLPQISGTITVLGDETIDLQQMILLEGQKLDVVHVTHNFTNGFTTQVTLTNERFVPTPVLVPPVVRVLPESERDKRKGLLIEGLDSDIQKIQELSQDYANKREDDGASTNQWSVYK